MVKIEISVDEKWPFFTLEKTEKEKGQFIIELNEDFYKEYLYFMYKHYEYQTRIQIIYEQKQREFTERCGFSFPEGSKIEYHQFNTTTESSKP